MKNALPSTVPQLSFALLYREVLTWLLGLNPRRVQVPLTAVAAFMAGVLWTRNAATCAAIAMGGAFSHDALNRLLIGSSLRSLLQMVALTMVKRITGYLVIDDVVIEKSGKKIPGVAWLYSSAEFDNPPWPHRDVYKWPHPGLGRLRESVRILCPPFCRALRPTSGSPRFEQTGPRCPRCGPGRSVAPRKPGTAADLG